MNLYGKTHNSTTNLMMVAQLKLLCDCTDGEEPPNRLAVSLEGCTPRDISVRS